MQRQGGGACWRAGGEIVNGVCAPVRGGGVPDGCVTGQCGLSVMGGGGGCGCGTGINPKLFGGAWKRRTTRRNRKQTRKNRKSRKNRKNTRRSK